MTISPNRPNYSFKTVNGLPEPEAWTKQLATGIAEVLVGERPVFQLMRWVSFDVYREIDRQIQPKNELHAKRSRPFVRSLRIETPNEKVVEATGSFNGEVKGINNLQAEYVAKYGEGNYKPNIPIAYWTFRLMIGLGTLALLFAVYAL